jgi:hypothetical protein
VFFPFAHTSYNDTPCFGNATVVRVVHAKSNQGRMIAIKVCSDGMVEIDRLEAHESVPFSFEIDRVPPSGPRT